MTKRSLILAVGFLAVIGLMTAASLVAVQNACVGCGGWMWPDPGGGSPTPCFGCFGDLGGNSVVCADPGGCGSYCLEWGECTL